MRPSPLWEAHAQQPRTRPLQPISFKRHRFPPEVISYAVWAYFRFTMSLRDVEDLLAERGIEVSYEGCCQVNLPGSQKPFPHPDVHAAVVAAAHV